MASPSDPRPDPSRRPVSPWRPAQLKVYGIYKRQRKTRATQLSDQPRRPTVSYDVRFRVDGHEFRYGFDKKAWADTFADQLREHFVTGCLFDPVARRFVPRDDATNTGPTFVEHAADYFRRKWPTWAPSSRRNAQADLARACLQLMRRDTPTLTPTERIEADRFLRQAVFIVPAPDRPAESDQRWQTWFDRWSLPLREVTDVDLVDFLEAVRTTGLDGTRRTVAPNSMARTRTVVRAAFTSARKRRLIDWDPWDAVEWKLPPDEDKIDPDLVMDQAQVLGLAARVAEIDRRYECFVLIQGLCGLRPGEARELRRRDLDLGARPATVTVRGSHTEVAQRFLDEDESRQRPLKRRGPRAGRTIPIPAWLVPRLQAHLDVFVTPRADALVFTTLRGRRIHLSNFHRDVWEPPGRRRSRRGAR
jgi:integrase